ncbi:DNA methyltransferase [Paenibacillus sp. CMAA1739]|uniref:DNA methyltransferase n=1 Tax=Paenibacillus ottowii TaxID=2315729 RepID=UPI002DB79D25|nr:DNA methyltransferase [Paenibacillus sp. CMAA1739]MEC4565504.1 DNA methyltransferase [Paenibacillus sp. CMAA1739]
MNGKIIKGDNLKVMTKIKDNYVDSCISDFPYFLEFMGKSWDKGSPYEWSLERAKDLFRILKTGGFVLIFGHAKTNHRVKAAFEDAGFNIVDEIDWLYMTGFPKNQDIGKLFDKRAGAKRTLSEKQRPIGGKNGVYEGQGGNWGETVNEPQTELAKIWDGWKTAGLKPAKETIMVFQKPLEGTYCNNIEKFGCGGMNIDACRIPSSEEDQQLMNAKSSRNTTTNYSNKGEHIYGDFKAEYSKPANELGRFPMNIVTLDESLWFGKWANPFPQWTEPELSKKCSTKEKTLPNGTKNIHPTVKPIELIKWLIKLVTPQNGVTIDITAGSCTHGVACEQLNKEGYNLKWCNIEMDEDENGNSLGYIDFGNERLKYI